MLVNTGKLVGKMAELKVTRDQLARELGISPTTLWRKLNGGGAELTLDEASKIIDILHLSTGETRDIFPAFMRKR